MIPIFIVDAFADAPFKGNPAAVALLSRPLPDPLLLSIAAELNLSETAFLLPMIPAHATDNVFATADRFSLRWFTPTCEVPLCGHATLAAAAVLLLDQHNPSTQLTFETRQSGELTVRRASRQAAEALGVSTALTMSLPYLLPSSPLPPCLSRHGNLVRIASCGLNVTDVCYNASVRYLLLVVDATLESLTMATLDMSKLQASSHQVSGVIVAIVGSSELTSYGLDMASRFFGPWIGIPEDPVTGSAHAVLAPYVAKKLNKGGMLRALQVSKRTGRLLLEPMEKEGVVEVTGGAKIVLRGEMNVGEVEAGEVVAGGGGM